MNINLQSKLLIIIACLFQATFIYGQGSSCNQADPFCSNSGATFPAGVNNGTYQPSGNNYSCGGGIWSTLVTQPNAAWYYLQISTAGNLEITLTNSNNVDVDFALWGPFASLSAAAANCGSLPQAIDCSFNPQSTEIMNINGAQVGQVYILMITNYSNQATNISANQTAGGGATNCTIVTTCTANAGTVAVGGTGTTGTSGGITTVSLCDGQNVSLTSNDNYSLPNNATGETSELMYAIYNCAPPNNPDIDAPGTDACFSGVFWSAEDFNTTNAGSMAQNSGGGLPQAILDAGITGTNNTIWFVPVTVDDGNNSGNPNGIINIDTNGDNCYAYGTPISVTYAAAPDISIANDCNTTTNSGSVAITVVGTGTYTLTDTGAGNIPGGSSVTGGSTFNINNLSNGDTWSFTLSQGGCTSSFSGSFVCGPDLCLVDAAITANPPASNYPNNQYPPGTTVNFCVDINQYNQSFVNFLHGIVPVMGAGWTNIASTQVPAVAANNEQGSYWNWMPGNSVTHNNGTTGTGDDYPITQPGWWFHSVNTPTGPVSPAPADPDNGWGDGCTLIAYPTTQATCLSTIYGEWHPGIGCTGGILGDLYVGPAGTDYDILDNSMTQTTCVALNGTWANPPGPGGSLCVFPNGDCYGNPNTGFGLQWTACWNATTATNCSSNPSLSVQVNTYADGQTGNWTQNGCTGDQPVPGPTASICCLSVPVETTPATFCQGSAISLTATNPNSPAVGNFDWYTASSGGTPVGTGNNFNPGALPAGTYTYYVEINNNGCISNRIPVAFTVNPLPTISSSSGNVIRCVGAAGNTTISVTLTNDTDNTVVWTSSPAGFASTSNTINVAPNVTTTYTATAQNACGIVTLPIVVSVYTPTPPNVANATICGTSLTLDAGAGYTNYTWAAGSGGAISGTNNTQTVTVTSAGTYTVTVTDNGCTATDSAVITSGVSIPTITGNTTACSGGSVTLNAGAGFSVYNWSNSGGSGASATFNNITTTTTYTVTVTSAGGCTATDTHQVTVTPTPTVTDPTDQIVCAGANTTAVTFSGTAGATFNWTNNTPSIGLAASGTGNIAVFAATNAGTTPVVATITVTPTIGSSPTCTGTAQTFTITVNPLPTVTDPTDQTVCANTSTTAVTFSGTAGATFNWTNNTPSIGLAASGTGNIAAFTATNAGTTPVVATITVTPTISGCPGTPQTFTITVNPLPTVTDPADQAVCEGATVTIPAFTGSAGASFSWSNSNTAIGLAASGSGNIASFTATNAGTTPISATITVTPTVGSSPTCTGTAQTFTITVNASNPVTLSPLSALCANATPITLNTTQSGITGAWSGSGVTGNSFNPSGLSGAITLTFTPTAGQCADITTTTVTVNTPPSASISGSATFCPGGSTTLSAPAGMTTYAWATSGGSIPGGTSGNPSITVNTAGTYTVTITDGNTCTATATIGVTQQAALNPNITGGGTICANATPATLDAGTGFATYTWGAGAGGTISGGTSSQTANATTTGTYTVTVTQGACSGTGTTTLTVNPVPTVTAPANQSFCHNASTTPITISGTAGATFNWSNNNIAIGLAASGTGNIPAFTATNAGASPITANITITPVLSGCSGTPQSFTITINPLPTVTDPANETVCAGANTAAVTFSGTAGATYTWTNNNASIGLAASGTGNIGAFAATNSGSSPITATVTVTPTLNSCPGTPQSFDITVNPLPTVTDPANQTVCAGSSTAAVTFSGTAGATYTWTNNNTSTGLAASGTSNISAFTATNSGSSPITSTVTVTPTLNSCPGTPQNFDITVNPLPTVTVPPNQTFCNGASSSVPAFTGTTGATFSWSNSNTAIGLAASGTGNIGSFTPTNTGSSPISATITVTPTIGSSPTCTGTAQTFTITVNPSPTVNPASPQTVCAGQPVTAISFNGSAGATFSWSNSNTAIGLAASGTGNIASFTATNATASAITATITVTPTSGSSPTCSGTPQTFTITVNPLVTPTLSVSPTTLCASDAPITLNTTQSGITGTWSGSGVTGGNTFNPSGLSGAITLTFQPTAGQCANNNTTTVTVNAPTAVTLTSIPNLCSIDSPVTLIPFWLINKKEVFLHQNTVT